MRIEFFCGWICMHADCFLSSRVSLQLQRKEPWHRFSALSLCRGKTSLPSFVFYSTPSIPLRSVPFLFCLYASHLLPSILPSGNLYYFISLRSLQSSIIPASFLFFSRFTCLWCWPHYSIAVQGKMHQNTFFPPPSSSLLPTCKVDSSNPEAS